MKKSMLVVTAVVLFSSYSFAAESPMDQKSYASFLMLPREIQKEILKDVEDYKTIKAIAGSSKSLKALIDDMKDKRELNPAVLWSFQDIIRKRPFTGHINISRKVAFNQDQQIEIVGKFSNAQIVNAKTGDIIHTLLGHSGTVTCVALSPDGQIAITGSTDKTAKVWNVATGQLIRTLVGHTGAPIAIAISADNHTAITGSADRTAKIWDLSTGNIIQNLDDSAPVSAVAVSADNEIAITGALDNTAKIWNVATGQLIQTLVGHRYSIPSVALSPDKKIAVTGSTDSTAKIWNVSTGELIQTLVAPRPVLAVKLSNDKTTIITGLEDGSALMWDISKRD